MLRSISGPVGVAAVCGRARQGKSYVLNAVARTAGAASPAGGAGFTVAATHKPCTKGLWLWSAPIPRTAPDGTRYATALFFQVVLVGVFGADTLAPVTRLFHCDRYHLILLDSEGVDAYDQTGA